MEKAAAAPRGGDDVENFVGWEHASAATRLLQRRRQMFEIQEQLEQYKLEHQSREVEFKKKEAALEAKDLELQNHLVMHSKFLQEKDTNRIRSDRKYMDEKRLKEQKGQQLKEMEALLKELRAKYKVLSTEWHKNTRYESYMDQICTDERYRDEYSEPDDVRGRWALLDDLGKEVEGHAIFFLTSSDDYKGKILALEDQQNAQIQSIQNEMSEKREQYEELANRSTRLQAECVRAHELKQDREIRAEDVKMACESIYQRLCDKSTTKTPPLSTMKNASGTGTDTIMVLKKSKDMIADFMAIVAENRHPQEPAAAATQGSPG